MGTVGQGAENGSENTEQSPVISVICPSRGRPESFAKSLAGLKKMATQHQYEVLAYIDEDDPRLADYRAIDIPEMKMVIGPRFGFANLHLAISQALLPLARGKWIFLWNDDTIMRTKGWDKVIADQRDEYVLCPDTNHRSHQTGLNVFPAIPKKWVDLTGWAQDGANDTWWQVISQLINRAVNIPVFILHDREDLTGGHKDQTRAENDYNNKNFFSQMNYAKMGFSAGRIFQKFLVMDEGSEQSV